jgi:hypothetical protein
MNEHQLYRERKSVQSPDPKKNQTFSINHFFTLCGLSSIITFTFESQKGKKKKEKRKTQKTLFCKTFSFSLT